MKSLLNVFSLILFFSCSTWAQEIPPPLPSKYKLILSAGETFYGGMPLENPDHLKGVLTDSGVFIGRNSYIQDGIRYYGVQSVDIK